MNSRGIPISRAAAIALVACFAAVSAPLPISAAADGPSATSAKKCKKKKQTPYSKKRRCKKRRAVLPASISISPTSQDFGSQSLGTTTRSFTVANPGGSPSGLPVPTITGPNAASFSLGANTCAGALPPAVSCEIDVDFRFVGTAGPQSATLNVTAVPGRDGLRRDDWGLRVLGPVSARSVAGVVSLPRR
jgi:hypothetical protein